MKKFWSVILAIALSLSCMAGVHAQDAFDDDYSYSYEHGVINVMFNDTELDFGNYPPEIINGRAMVPAREFFTGIGAKISYNGAGGKAEISAAWENGTKLTVKTGSKTVTVVKNGETKNIEMDVMPYLNPKVRKVYVPVKFIADALNYGLIYEEWYNSIYLTDKDALIKEIDSHFTIFNRLIQSNAPLMEKTYSTKINMTSTGTLYGDKTDDTVDFDVSMDVLNKGLNINAAGTVKLDVSKLSEKILDLFGDDGKEEIKKLQNGSFNMIANAENAFKKSNFAEMADKDTWVKSDSEEMFVEYLPYIMLKDMKNFTIGNMIYSNNGDYYYGYNGSPYEEMLNKAKDYQLYFSDECFTQKTYGVTTIYTAKMDSKTFEKRMKELDVSYTDFIFSYYADEKIPDLKYNLVLKEKDGILTEVTLDGSIGSFEMLPIDTSYHFFANQNGMEGFVEFKGLFLGKYRADMSATWEETDKQLQSEPPEGEKVIDEEDLYEEYYNSKYGDDEEEEAAGSMKIQKDINQFLNKLMAARQ